MVQTILLVWHGHTKAVSVLKALQQLFSSGALCYCITITLCLLHFTCWLSPPTAHIMKTCLANLCAEVSALCIIVKAEVTSDVAASRQTMDTAAWCSCNVFCTRLGIPTCLKISPILCPFSNSLHTKCAL
eukprot:2666243-Ditylum_brightwellii.AAC.2